MQIIRTQAERPLITTEKLIMPQGDHIDLSNANISGANLTIKSTLTNVTQAIGALPDTGAAEKARLEALIQQLAEVLQQVPADKAQDAERVGKLTERAVEDARSGDKSLFEISAEGLRKAAEALADVVPAVIAIVKQILALLGKPGG